MKKDIAPSDLGLDFLNQLRPVSYHWKSGADRDLHYGLIAQDTEQAIKSAHPLATQENTPIVDHDAKSDRYGIRYTELISPIIRAIQEIYAKLTAQDARILALQKENDAKLAQLRAENAQLLARIQSLEHLAIARQNAETHRGLAALH